MMWPAAVDRLLQWALEEDVGRGDITSEAVIPPHLRAAAVVRVKEAARVCGLPMAEAVFRMMDREVECQRLVQEGADVDGPSAVMRVEGPARAVLSAERTALNVLARLTGVATLTRRAVAELAGTRARLLDTRKTTPGWRWLEKYAVRVGGGLNHRYGLDHLVLIKDNHIAICGGVAQAVERARAAVGPAYRIELEVETLAQLDEALAAGADMILLDNMSLPAMAAAVERTAGRVPLEASGGVTLERLRAIAETGVDYISMGALTHSAVSVDVGLDVEEVAP